MEKRGFLRDRFAFDLHGHPAGLFPLPMRIKMGKALPPDVRLADLKESGVNGYVINAVGDPNSILPAHRDEWQSTQKQISRFRRNILLAGSQIASNAADLVAAAEGNEQVMVLGVEGGDCIGDNLDRLSLLRESGVRHFQLLHYRNNRIGSIGLKWSGAIPTDTEHTGLTDFGKKVVRSCNELGLIVDLSHADEETVFSVLEQTTAPVTISHTGPKVLQPFPRYISDDVAVGIAKTGGVVGLWLFRLRDGGMSDLEDFERALDHWLGLIGPEHIGIGTDVNGVPGNCDGFTNVTELGKLVDIMKRINLDDDSINRIVGGNFVRLFSKVESVKSQ